jgi:hypothetical protein
MVVQQQPIEDWAHSPWRKLEKKVYRLQKRIYQASDRGDEKSVHSLQRLLLKSEAARPLAVRRVTQDNQGKRTAGVDGVRIRCTSRTACHGQTLAPPNNDQTSTDQTSLDTEAWEERKKAVRHPNHA